MSTETTGKMAAICFAAFTAAVGYATIACQRNGAWGMSNKRFTTTKLVPVVGIGAMGICGMLNGPPRATLTLLGISSVLEIVGIASERGGPLEQSAEDVAMDRW